MGKSIDMVGQKFNKLTVIKKVSSRSSSGTYWECLCACGKTTITSRCHLIQGHTTSCGCHRRGLLENGIRKKHGRSKNKDRTYKTWKEMRSRCSDPNKDNYKWYGGKGIIVCDRWSDFNVFLSDMGERPEGMTLDRINSDKDYSPENCRWATKETQMRFVKHQPRNSNNSKWVAFS